MEVARRTTKWLDDRNWLFPAILFVLVIILAAFKISGTSAGVFHAGLYGPNVPDKNLLYGQPQSVRSDEWLVDTPYTMSQSRLGYPKTNTTVGSGMDAAVLMDLPSKDWSELFKPQNWAFFVIPVQQAFAFRWWLFGWLMITGGYFVVLLLLPRRRLLAALLSLGLFFTPFVQWWYETAALAPVYYCFFSILIFWYILHAVTARQKIALAASLGYVLSCFALVLYPPFQITCALVVTVVGLGMILEHKWSTWDEFAQAMIPVLAAAAISGAVICLFFLTHGSTVKAIEDTVYPGHRVVASGGFSIAHYLDGAFDRQLEKPVSADHYVDNQSEESNFVFLWPYLLVPSLYLSYLAWRRHRYLDYFSLTVAGLLLLFAARIFLPLPKIFGEVLLLSSIPHARLLLGMGVLNFLEVVTFVRQVQKNALSARWALTMGCAAGLVQLSVGLYIRMKYPVFISNIWLIAGISAAVGLVIYLLVKRKAVAAAAILLLLGIWSTHKVNPLYVGLGELSQSKLGAAAASQPSAYTSGWVYVGDIRYINLLQAYGLHTYSGTYPYPQMSLMRQLDPTRRYLNVYNRYAYVLFDPTISGMKFYQQDEYAIGYNPCGPVFKKLIQNIVTETPMNNSCLHLRTTVSYPAAYFYIYSVK